MDEESEDTSSTSEGSKCDIDKYRKLVRFYLDANSTETARFWADKVVSLSEGEPQDVYWLAQCMYRSGEYQRSWALIKNRGLDKCEPLCQWLAGKALFEAHLYSDALVVLLTEEEQAGITRTHPLSLISAANLVHTSTPPIDGLSILEGFTPNTLRSAILLLKGKIYEKMENRSKAADCYKQALKFDIYCFEAFQALIHHHFLTSAEEKELLGSLNIKDKCIEGDLLPTVYELLVNKYYNSPQMMIQLHPNLHDNMDMEVARAERLYYACAYEECYQLAESLISRDPYHATCLPLFISCLVELNKPTRLFQLAHDLVDTMPEKAIAWFAVGCYYYLIGKRDPARRYLGKATSLDKLFGPAWLAYGHSFAVEGEHDQAMATYFSATKLMRGCHLPLLYIGLECGLTNNVRLAEKYFTQAHNMAPNDPFVIHEIGVIAFQNRDYKMAEKHFLTALSQVHEINQSVIAHKWEPLLNNLGHTCRKLKKYDDALRYHQQALVLSPQNASTLSCIGFIHALKRNITEAIDMFHKALFLKRDDSFTLSMLSYTIEMHLEQPDSDKIPDLYIPQIASFSKSSKGSKGKGTKSSMGSKGSKTTLVDDTLAYIEHLTFDFNLADAEYNMEPIEGSIDHLRPEHDSPSFMPHLVDPFPAVPPGEFPALEDNSDSPFSTTVDNSVDNSSIDMEDEIGIL